MYVCDCGWSGTTLLYQTPNRPLPASLPEGTLQGYCPRCQTPFQGCVQLPKPDKAPDLRRPREIAEDEFNSDDDAPLGAVYAAPPVRINRSK